MLHGLGASTHSWRGLAPLLAQHYRVVMVDLPGHAFTSTPTAQSAGLQAMAQALHDLLDQLNWWPQVVVGHSAGATLAARMVLNHPERPSPSLVAFNPAWLPLAGMAHWLFPLSAKLISLNPLSAWMFAKTMQQDKLVFKILNSTGSAVRPAEAFFYKALMQSPSHVQGVLQMMLHHDLGALPQQLAELKNQVLILAAENDQAVPHDHAVTAQQRIPGATLLSLQGLGHLAHEENPALCALEVLKWLALKAQTDR
jgi:magnesium chelatase accessory protein